MITLQNALDAVQNRKEFAVIRENGLVCINYLVQLPDSFEGIRSNFRGITFDETTGELLSLPLSKFYNVNQTEETQYHKLMDLDATIYEKVDGSLIHFFTYNDQLLSATRMKTGTIQAVEAHKLLTPNLTYNIWGSIQDGYTPCFEYVAPSNQIVVEYPRPRLIYLISRNRKTGEYVNEDRYLTYDHVQKYTFSFSKLMEELEQKQNFEGYVCHLSNGIIVKAKCNWYIERHRVVDVLMKPIWKLYELVFEDKMDDLIAVVNDSRKGKLEGILVEATKDLLDCTCRMQQVYNQCLPTDVDRSNIKEHRKQYALKVQAQFRDCMSGAMALYDGKEIMPICKDRLIECYRKTKTKRLFEEITDDS